MHDMMHMLTLIAMILMTILIVVKYGGEEN